MKIRTLLGIMFFVVVTAMLVVGLNAMRVEALAISHPLAVEDAKRSREADRLRVLFDSEEAYEAIVDNYKTGKTIGEVLDEILKEKP